METYYEVFQENTLVGKAFPNNVYHKIFKKENAYHNAMSKGKELISYSKKNKDILANRYTKITVIVRETDFNGKRTIHLKESVDL